LIGYVPEQVMDLFLIPTKDEFKRPWLPERPYLNHKCEDGMLCRREDSPLI